MKWNSLILGLTLATGAGMTQPPMAMAQTPALNDAARKLYREGDDLYSERNFVEAEKKLREALTKYPKSDQADRTAFLLIKTLIKLDRIPDARAEVEKFNRAYPNSRWKEDVETEALPLVQWSREALLQEQKVARERAEAERRGNPELPRGVDPEATILRMMIRMDPTEGFEIIRERLKRDPSDPVAVPNLGSVFSSNSPQALPFLLDLSKNAASAEVREIAFFYAMRKNPDRIQVANTFIDMLTKKENERIVSEALYRMLRGEHQQVLDKIVSSSNPGKFDAMEKIYRGPSASITLKCDLLSAAARLQDARALNLMLDAAQNDMDLKVRECAETAIEHRPAARNEIQRLLRGGVGGPTPTPLPGRGGPNRLVPTIPTSLPPFPQQ
jgi:tetratricopeptide (TPR) repeat protein